MKRLLLSLALAVLAAIPSFGQTSAVIVENLALKDQTQALVRRLPRFPSLPRP
jgi:hypothetical protein